MSVMAAARWIAGTRSEGPGGPDSIAAATAADGRASGFRPRYSGRRPSRPPMRPLLTALAALLLPACFPAVDGTRQGDPAMRARFPTHAEDATECMARVWESVRTDWPHGPLKVSARFIAGRGSIAVELPPATAVPWLSEVQRAGDGAVAAAWSRRIMVIDVQPVFANVMRQAVATCRGELTEDRFERERRSRGLARAD
jgi:hypothetical protein